MPGIYRTSPVIWRPTLSFHLYPLPRGSALGRARPEVVLVFRFPVVEVVLVEEPLEAPREVDEAVLVGVRFDEAALGGFPA